MATGYYGQPVVKASPYNWLVAAYVFVGGLAGFAQVLAALADLLSGGRDRAVVRGGRYLALLGALLSPPLLVADLHTPGRWYNMLRVVRLTSPMSIGSWTLAGFGMLSGVVAAGQALDDGRVSWLGPLGRWTARLLGVPAALLGGVMAVYTGSLLAATSTPLWLAAPRHLPALFGASAASAATAALGLALDLAGASAASRRRLERIGLVAGAAQVALTLATEREWRRRRVEGAAPVGVGRAAVLGLSGLALGGLAARTLTGRGGDTLGRAAALAALSGSFLERALVLRAGNASTRDPAIYLGLTAAPQETPRA